jgi:hypothetical protein
MPGAQAGNPKYERTVRENRANGCRRRTARLIRKKIATAQEQHKSMMVAANRNQDRVWALALARSTKSKKTQQSENGVQRSNPDKINNKK